MARLSLLVPTSSTTANQRQCSGQHFGTNHVKVSQRREENTGESRQIRPRIYLLRWGRIHDERIQVKLKSERFNLKVKYAMISFEFGGEINLARLSRCLCPEKKNGMCQYYELKELKLSGVDRTKNVIGLLLNFTSLDDQFSRCNIGKKINTCNYKIYKYTLFNSVKPAIFDLFLALGIAAYLGALYFITLVCIWCSTHCSLSPYMYTEWSSPWSVQSGIGRRVFASSLAVSSVDAPPVVYTVWTRVTQTQKLLTITIVTATEVNK